MTFLIFKDLKIMYNNKKGVTLVELIVTVCIVVALSGGIVMGLNFLDKSNIGYDNQMAANYQNALRIYVTNSIRDKHPVSLDIPEHVANSITSVMGQATLDFSCKTKNYKMYYSPSNLAVVAGTLEAVSTDNPDVKVLPAGSASGPKA